MKVHCIAGRNYDSNIYIILGEKPTIIDCGTGMNANNVHSEISKIISPEEIKQIILTHEHFDHCGGAKKLLESGAKNAKVYCHKNAAEKIQNGESDFAKMLGAEMPKTSIDVKLKDSDLLKLGDEEFVVMHTPGHSPGSMCLYSKESRSLISGDTIFAFGSFGRYDFAGGDGKKLRKSIERISKLDVKNLYPGHDATVEKNAEEHIAMTLNNTSYLI